VRGRRCGIANVGGYRRRLRRVHCGSGFDFAHGDTRNLGSHRWIGAVDYSVLCQMNLASDIHLQRTLCESTFMHKTCCHKEVKKLK